MNRTDDLLSGLLSDGDYATIIGDIRASYTLGMWADMSGVAWEENERNAG